MAKRRLKYRARTVNSRVSSKTQSATSNPPVDVLDIIDRVEDGLGKIKSMLEIVHYDGIQNCTVLTQLRYVSIMEDLLTATTVSFRKLRDYCLAR